MRVYKEVCLLVGCWIGSLLHVQAVFQPAVSPVKIDIDPVPDYVCAGSQLSFHASIANVEGEAEVRIAAGLASARGTGMGAAGTTLSVGACQPGLMTVYFSFGDYGSFSSNVVVIGIDGVEAVPAGPICAPAVDPIQYRAFPTDLAGYALCPPQWTGPNLVVDPQDPWRASAQCDRGGYYYAIAALGQDPPCRIWEMSERIKACEVKLLPAFGQDYGQPYIFPNICINAQPAYKRARYRVELLPSDSSATVSLADGSVDVDLSNKKVGNHGTFYVIARETPGTYRIRLSHSDLPVCDAVREGTVFRFDLTAVDTGANAPSQMRGVGTYNAAAGSVVGSTPDVSAAGHGAILTRVYEARVEAVPPDSFNGRVRKAMEIQHTLIPSATIYKNAAAINGTLALTATMGFLRVTLVGSGNHTIASATFNAAVQVGDSPAIDAGNFTYSSDDFIVALFWGTKVFGIPVVQTMHDIKRIFQVGAGQSGIPVRGTIGVLCVRRDGLGAATVERAEGIGRLNIKAAEESDYEIVP